MTQIFRLASADEVDDINMTSPKESCDVDLAYSVSQKVRGSTSSTDDFDVVMYKMH